MVIEYVEKGQVMVCDMETMNFTSPISSIIRLFSRYRFNFIGG